MNTQPPAPDTRASLYRLSSNSTSDVPQSDRIIEPSLHGTDSNSDDDALTVGRRSRINSMTNFEFIEAIASSPVPRSPMSLQCCCGREDCNSLQLFYRSARSLEEELRLAAEVGQTVLQRHQMTQREMGELEKRLTEQCVAAEQRAQELEDIVRELKESQRKLTSERDDATRQKHLLEKKNESLTSQLDDRDAQLRDLSKEFKDREDDIKRLMTNKWNAERGEEREDELRRQLEDLKQELNVARKAESAAEARVKKLKAKYDTLHTAHEKLKKEYQEYPISVPKQNSSEFFKQGSCSDDANRSSFPSHESNAHFANRIKELSSENNKLKETNTCFTAMIRELSSANDKLKAQITEYKEMLTETRNEVSTLQDKIVDIETASAHGYSTYAASYTTNTSIASPFVRTLPPHVSDEVISVGEQSEITATVVDEIAEASNPQDTIPRPILTQISTFPLSSSLGPTTHTTLNSLGADNSLNSPAGSAAMLSSSNPLHYHHYYHHYHHYAPESPEVPRGSVLGELEKEIKGSLKQQHASRRRQHDSYKRNKVPLDTVNDVDEEEILTDESESTAENKAGRSDEIVYDTDTYSEDSDGERDVTRDSNAEENTKNRRGKRNYTVGKSSSAKPTKAQQKAKAKDGISASPKKKQKVSPLSTTLKGNNVSLLSAGLKKSTESAALKNDADKKKRVPSINTKAKDEMKPSHRRTPLSPTTGSSLSRRSSLGKSTGASTSVSKHKPTQSSPLAQRRAASATPSSLSVRVSQSSNSPTSGRSARSSAERLSMPAFKNPKFATLGPRERKAMMEAWRAGVAKEHEVFTEDNLDTATITDECGSTSLSQNATPTGVPSIMLSAPAERNDASTNNRDLDSPHHQSPYQALFNLCTHLMDRLKGTDIIALNRRLKREFDILELSSLSNNLIENILSDVENLRERFRWVEELRISEGEKANVKALHGDLHGNKDLYAFSPEEFLPLTHFMQDTLGEIGKLRMLVNDVQVSYFQKVEESRRKAEEEFGKSIMNNRDDNEVRSNQNKRRQRNEGGISGYLSRVFGGLREQPPNTTRHHTRRMSVEYSHEREISVGSIDTFAEDSYFADRNVDAYRTSNTRRESVDSVGTIVRKSMVSFFGGGGGGSNGNTNMSTTSTVYEARGEEVEKARNSKGLKMNLEDTRGGRNSRSHRLSMSNYWRESGMDRSLLSSFSITPPLRSPTFTAIRSSESETSSLQPVLASPPPPTIETAAIRKARTVSSASTLESRLRQHLAAGSSSAGDSASVKDDSQKDEGSESFFDKWFG